MPSNRKRRANEPEVLSRIDLNLLQVFDTVMVERHVTRASVRLGLTQSAVSNSLSRLRTLFSDRLFIKSSRGVLPTKRALAIWPEIHEAIARLQGIVQPERFAPATSTREFRLSVVDLDAALLTPHLFSCIQREAPRVSLSFVPQVPELLAERLARGEVDFAISVEPPRMVGADSVPLWTEEFVITGRRGHPKLKSSLSLEELCCLPQLVVNLSGTLDFVTPFDSTLAEHGLKREVLLTVNQFLVATAMLRESDLVAVLPKRLVADVFRQKWLAFQNLPVEFQTSTVYLSWHRRNIAQPSMRWMHSKIIEAANIMKKMSPL